MLLNQKKRSKHSNMGCYISRKWGDETPQRIASKFFVVIDIHDLITCIKFGVDRLRGFRLVRGQISPFPIYFAGRPYNTLTLPCESVISRIWGEETPQRIASKLFLVVDIPDLIMYVKFGDDRLRGLGLVRGQSSPFPIYFAGRPYNTLTLPCESVIQFINIKLKI